MIPDNLSYVLRLVSEIMESNGSTLWLVSVAQRGINGWVPIANQYRIMGLIKDER